MKKILALLVAFVLTFTLGSCVKKTQADESSNNTVADYEDKGSGRNQFYLDICFEKGEKHYNIRTDKDTVGAALEELEIIDGEQGDYGLYILSVEGEVHKYENGGKYWSFFIGKNLAPQSVDRTKIENGTSYSLKVAEG